jgi:hypothetical protein
LPAFFFILVFSFGFDFVAELLFFLTGIDTSSNVAAAGQAPKPPEPSGWASMASPSGWIIETCYSEIKPKADHL